MNVSEEVAFFAKMYNTDKKYAKQCIDDVCGMILELMRQGHSVLLPGVISISIRPRYLQKRTKSSQFAEKLNLRYQVHGQFKHQLMEAAQSETAMKHAKMTKEMEEAQDAAIRKRKNDILRKAQEKRARRRQKLYGKQ